MSQEAVFRIDLTRTEVDELAEWHRESEKRYCDMREYCLADEHKQRTVEKKLETKERI